MGVNGEVLELIPGDPDGVGELRGRLEDIAVALDDQAEQLVALRPDRVWESEAGAREEYEHLRDAAVPKLERARARFQAVAIALDVFEDELRGSQDDVADALERLHDAQARLDTPEETAPPLQALGDDNLVEADPDGFRGYALALAAVDDAQSDVDAALRRRDDAVGELVAAFEAANDDAGDPPFTSSALTLQSQYAEWGEGDVVWIPPQAIPVNSEWGVVRINLFIGARNTGGWVTPSAGDNRDFDDDAGVQDSRVSLLLDFENGQMIGAFNNTCRPGYSSCAPALPLGEGNQVDVLTQDDGAVAISVQATNPYIDGQLIAPLAQAADMSIDMDFVVGPQVVSTGGADSVDLIGDMEYPLTWSVEPRQDHHVPFGVSVRGDSYPSVEVYQEIDGQVRELLTNREDRPFLGVPLGLLGEDGRDLQYPPASELLDNTV